jgi:hypothetical protein
VLLPRMTHGKSLLPLELTAKTLRPETLMSRWVWINCRTRRLASKKKDGTRSAPHRTSILQPFYRRPGRRRRLVVHVDLQLGIIVVGVGFDFTAELNRGNQHRKKK